MKRSAIVCVLLAAATVHADPSSRALDLEPCINGGVSALGTHETQYAEDLARIDDTIDPFDELALEPCINGDVSPRGTAIGSVDAEPVIKIVQEAR